MTFEVQTDHPVALASYDYLYPLGAIYGWKENDSNPKFVAKLEKFPGDILDLGCCSGSFVKSCLDGGRIAIGLEGNDYGSKNNWGDWATIPENLLLADITKPFTVHTGDTLLHHFGVITAWEVMEHIELKDLDQVFTNIKNHLSPKGVLVASISNKESFNKRHSVDLHRIHENLDWWADQFAKAGLVRDTDTEHYFAPDWVRNEKNGFHLVVKKK